MVSQIDVKIQEATQKLNYYNELAAKSQGYAVDSAQREAAKWSELKSQYEFAKSQEGKYTSESLIQYAQAQGLAPSERFAQRQAQEEYFKSPAFLKQQNQEIINQIQSQAPGRFQPVIIEGKLTGFQDVIQGKSIPLSSFEKGYSYSTQQQVPGQISQAQVEQPTLYEKQVGSFKDPETERQIPITQIYYKDSSGERKATDTERQEFRSGISVLRTGSNINVYQTKGYSPETYQKYKPIIQTYEAGKQIVSKVKGSQVIQNIEESIKEPIQITEKALHYADWAVENIGLYPIKQAGKSFKQFTQDIEKYQGINVFEPKYYEPTVKSMFPLAAQQFLPNEAYKIASSGLATITKDIVYRPEWYAKQYLYLSTGAKLGGKTFSLVKEGISQSGKIYEGALADTYFPKILQGADISFSFTKAKIPLTVKTTAKVSIGTVIGGSIATGLITQAINAPSIEEAIKETAISVGELYLIGKYFSKGEKAMAKTRTKTLVEEREYITAETKNVMVRGIDDKLTEYSKYKITSDVYPAEIEISSKTQRALSKVIADIEPIYKGPIGKPKTSIIKTPFLSKYGEDFVVIESGARKRSLSVISGTGEQLSYTELISAYPKGATPIQKRLIEDLAKTTEEKLVPKMFKQSADFQIGDVLETKYYKGYKNVDFDIKELQKGFQPYGKRETRAAYLSKIEEVPTKETSPVEVYREDLVFKETTKPLSRATGKVRRIEGIVIRLKEPIKYGGPEIKFGRFDELDLKANLQEKQYIQQIEKQTLKLLPKIVPKLPRITPSAEIKNILSEKPLGLAKSLRQVSAVQTAKQAMIYERDLTKGLVKPAMVERELSIEKITPFERNLLRSLIIEKEKTKFINKEINKEIAKDILKERAREKLQLKQFEKLKEKDMFKFKTKITTPPTEITRSMLRGISITAPKLPRLEEKIRKYKKKRELGYDVLKILKGKPQVIARGLYRGVALDIGAREVLKNLRATFILKKSEFEPRDVSTMGEFRKYSALFREPVVKSKYRKYGEVYIQKERKVPGLGRGRLSFAGELKEIKQSRKNKMERYLQ